MSACVVMLGIAAMFIAGCGDTRKPAEQEQPAPVEQKESVEPLAYNYTSPMSLTEAPDWDSPDYSVYEFAPEKNPGGSRFEDGLYYLHSPAPLSEKAELRRIDLATYEEEQVVDIDTPMARADDFGIDPSGRFMFVLARPREDQGHDISDLVSAAQGKSPGELNEAIGEMMFSADKLILKVYDLAAGDWVECRKDGALTAGIELEGGADFSLECRRFLGDYLVLPAGIGPVNKTGFSYRQFVLINRHTLLVSDFCIPFWSDPSSDARESLPEVTDININDDRVNTFCYRVPATEFYDRTFSYSKGIYIGEVILPWPHENTKPMFAQYLQPDFIYASASESNGDGENRYLQAAMGTKEFIIADLSHQDSGEFYQGAYFPQLLGFVAPVVMTPSPMETGDEVELYIVRLEVMLGGQKTVDGFKGREGRMVPSDFTADVRQGLFAGSMFSLSEDGQKYFSRLYIYDVGKDVIAKVMEAEGRYQCPRFFRREE